MTKCLTKWRVASIIAVLTCCAALVFALSGCAQQEQKQEEV